MKMRLEAICGEIGRRYKKDARGREKIKKNNKFTRKDRPQVHGNILHFNEVNK